MQISVKGGPNSHIVMQGKPSESAYSKITSLFSTVPSIISLDSVKQSVPGPIPHPCLESSVNSSHLNLNFPSYFSLTMLSLAHLILCSLLAILFFFSYVACPTRSVISMASINSSTPSSLLSLCIILLKLG